MLFRSNDFFNISGIGIASGQMTVFDRWGDIIYDSDSPKTGWDGRYAMTGTPCPVGVYAYKVVVVSEYGVSRTLIGRVTLVR